ncbi:hypothetical protein [Stenotrophomonas sp. A3_2]|uniref:hypothetical protein n=1 Tax=Stenotrophomonas sp. A3_2 TaxID=3119978 RepID=UPI002FC312A1
MSSSVKADVELAKQLFVAMVGEEFGDKTSNPHYESIASRAFTAAEAFAKVEKERRPAFNVQGAVGG